MPRRTKKGGGSRKARDPPWPRCPCGLRAETECANSKSRHSLLVGLARKKVTAGIVDVLQRDLLFGSRNDGVGKNRVDRGFSGLNPLHPARGILATADAEELGGLPE